MEERNSAGRSRSPFDDTLGNGVQRFLGSVGPGGDDQSGPSKGANRGVHLIRMCPGRVPEELLQARSLV